MKRSTLLLAALALALPATALAKDADWATKAPSDWTADDAAELLAKSPWVATIQVLPTALIGANQKIGKADRVPVQARWFSASIIRNAIARNAELQGAKMSPEEKAEQTRPDDRFYEILISSDKLDVLDSIPFPQLVKVTTLEAGGQTFPLVTLLRPSELKGQAQMIFNKKKGIPEGAKDVVLKSEWNGTKIEFKWDATKMVWPGACENAAKPTHDIVGDAKAEKPMVRDLDGDFCPVGPNETRRREIQAAVLGSGDDALDRAIGDIRVTRAKPEDKFSVYVFYDAAKETAEPVEGAKPVDVMGRKMGMTKAVGKWSAANKSPLKAIFFVKPGAQKPDDFIHASCAEKLAKTDAGSAEKFFKEKLTKPDSPTVPVCEETAAKPEPTKADKKPTGKK